MISGETIHLGGGVYFHFDGVGFELRANHHESPTHRVYLDPEMADRIVGTITETIANRRPDVLHPR
jgi:hypothetical protein